MKHKKSNGFTIVEILVVVAVIIVLGAITLSVATRVIRKSRASVMASNMKQAASFFTAYADDNQQQLLPCRGDLVGNDGTVDDNALWHEIICSMIFETTDPADFKDDVWWEDQDLFLRNPLFFASDGWDALNPGYGYNIMIPENYDNAEGGGGNDVERTLVPMAYLENPGRTPILAPCYEYSYRYDDGQIDEFDDEPLSNFLTGGNFPVLFLDGHIETMKPEEYVDRGLHEMPLDPND